MDIYIRRASGCTGQRQDAQVSNGLVIELD